jgi:protein-S-isoprenylcysteine O-methyltransferase Ste14
VDDTQRTFTPRAVILLFLFIVVIPSLPLLISWQWDWWEAWVYAVVNIGGFAISRILAGRKDPSLLAERAKYAQHDDAASWDKVLSPLVALGGGLIPLVAGLDARFGWSPGVALAPKVLALVVFLAGHLFGSWALIANRFFSGMVRIQTERGHQVVDSGPYAWVRHPGYAGALLTYFATPLLLGTLWAYLPAVFITAMLIIRTRLEDQTLQAQLEGYKEYAGRVRYRLIPGLW